MNNSKPKPDVFQLVTDKIIELLERGSIPWERPWRGGMPRNIASKKPYRGINTFLLAMTQEITGYCSNWWLTYKQAKDLGGQVKKGEKSTIVVFWKWLQYEDKSKTGEIITDPKTGEPATHKIPFLRYFRVFNIEQCDFPDGLKIPETDDGKPLLFEPIEICENVVQGMPRRPEITHSATPHAYYSPGKDLVHMPTKETFNTVEGYYSTLFHELAHSTSHEHRLNRKADKVAAYGDEDYSKEELVAEMGAAFLCGYCDIDKTMIENAAAYIQGWLKALKNDKKMVVYAAAQAQKAADYILDKGGDN